MKLPRDLSGEELVKHLCRRWEYGRCIRSAATSFLKPVPLLISALLFPNIVLCALAR